MPDFETVDSRESVVNPSPLIGSIRSLVRLAPVLAALLAVSACSKDGNNPELQAKLRACQIDSAKLEGILSGLNVDRAKLEGDSASFGDSDEDGLHACEVHKARLIGLSQGAEIDRRQFKLKLKAVGLGELVLDVPSAGERVRAKDQEELRQRWQSESLDAARSSGNPWGSLPQMPQNLKDKGFYYDNKGTLRRKGFDGKYFLAPDGAIIYFYPDGKTMKRLPSGGNPDGTWSPYTGPIPDSFAPSEQKAP